MSRTEENLKSAFAGESQANRKYLAFAQKADADGYNGIAKLFRAAAHAETIASLVGRIERATTARELAALLRHLG